MIQKSLTIVALGDSITNAVGKFGVTDHTAFRSIIKEMLQDGLGINVDVVNAGVNGDITPLALLRIRRDVLAHAPDIVTVMFGVNDAGYYRPQTDSFADTPRVQLQDFKKNLGQIVRKVQSIGAMVVIMTPLPMNRNYWGINHPSYVEHGLNFLVEQYAQAAREVAAAYQASLVDTYNCFAVHPAADELIPDGIHPNPDGHRIIAEQLYPVVERLARSIVDEE